MTVTNAQVLVVEDEALVAEDIKSHLEDIGHRVNAMASSGEEALQLLKDTRKDTRPDIILMDIVLDGSVDGIDTAQVIKQHYNIPVIYLTAYTDSEKLARAQATEPYGYLVKPFDERELRTTVAMALYKADSDRKVRENQLWAKAVLHSIADATITTDRQGCIQYLNPRAETLTGWSMQKALGYSLEHVLALIGKNQRKLLNDMILEALYKGELVPCPHDFNLWRADGGIIPIEVTTNIIRYEDGREDGLVVIFRDVTVQHEARKSIQLTNDELEQRVEERTRDLERSNSELADAKQRTEAASQAKNQFLANISHELRTPLNPAIGYAELMMHDEQLSADNRQYAKEIYNACMGLLDLINDLLDIAHSDNGKPLLRNDTFDLINLVQDVSDSAHTKAKLKGLAFQLELPPSGSLLVLSDPQQIQQILYKLVDNAVKFTDEGKIILRLEIRETGYDAIEACFTVQDTGIGIPTEIQEHIFDTFTQADGALSRRFEGAGVGLAFCKKIVERMDGKFGVDSGSGCGASFWFELPLLKSDVGEESVI